MYGLPSDTDLSFLHGAQLDQVCISQNEVILHLHPEVEIMIASTIELGGEQGGRILEDPRDQGLAICSRLGERIERAEGTSEGTLRLFWTSGHSIAIHDTWTEFESYTITQGKMVIVV